MARIELQALGHCYANAAAASQDAWAVQPLDLAFEDGAAYALLGPSGCGKTTLLNIISGLITPARGRVLFDARDVTRLTPEARNIAQVFQFPVVYDTMTVFDNLAFPLRNRGWPRAEIRKRVHEIAELLELLPDLGRRARGLGADAKQKISLGRGLVRPDVAAVLFDEPLTVIDPHMKWLLRRKLKQIHQQLKLSLIYVTHDQIEALTFADRVAVMMHGVVMQVGTPEALFAAPAHRFVGHFIGTPGMNFLDCTLMQGTLRIGATSIKTSSETPPPPGTALTVGIRPEFVQVVGQAGENCVPAQICSVRDQGTCSMIQLKVQSQLIWVRTRSAAHMPADTHAFVHLPVQHCALYADERRLE